MLFTVILTKNGTFFYQGTKFFSLPDKILFTFHYASTLSMTDFRRPAYSVIYIPLCFYFIHLRFQGALHVLLQFTFHYASTLSKKNVIRPMLQIHLHSTMLLLYLDYALERCLHGTPHLHSTMLLLYRCLTRSPLRWMQYLHSTMLLLYQSSGK